MLINRKRSARRGPKYSQTYVPHDQRRINTQPTPIMDEKTAQYYYNQLLTKGYINPTPYIVTIKHKNPGEELVMFEINSDQSLGNGGNVNSTNMQIFDIYGEPYKTPVISNEDILDRVGVKLYPILAKGILGVYNAVDVTYPLHMKDLDSDLHVTENVAPESYYYITEHYSYFDFASISTSGDHMFYSLHATNGQQQSQLDLAYCYYRAFFLTCDELTVLVYPA